MTVLVEKTDDSADQLFVFFPVDEKVGLAPIRVFCNRMKDVNVSRAIIIVKGALTAIAKNAISELSQRGFKLEYFKDAELLVDITEHKLVPEHVVLTDDEKKKLLERYRLKEFQLPRILVTDPVARYLGLERRKVVKIVRPSETAGRYVTYRICY
jgi:DNA-directed RNA polymerase I, II, and III subunit RPABC1